MKQKALRAGEAQSFLMRFYITMIMEKKKWPEQKQFVAQVPGAKLSVYPAKHEIYMSTNNVMEKYVPEVIGFLRG